jgi:hypothetical protein
MQLRCSSCIFHYVEPFIRHTRVRFLRFCFIFCAPFQRQRLTKDFKNSFLHLDIPPIFKYHACLPLPRRHGAATHRVATEYSRIPTNSMRLTHLQIQPKYKLRGTQNVEHPPPPSILNHSCNLAENLVVVLKWVLIDITIRFVKFSPLVQDMGVTYRILDLSCDHIIPYIWDGWK